MKRIKKRLTDAMADRLFAEGRITLPQYKSNYRLVKPQKKKR